MVNEVVIKPYCRGILAVVAVEYPVEACPINGTKTHGTGLARGVDVVPGEVE